jgi:hypothetical protein
MITWLLVISGVHWIQCVQNVLIIWMAGDAEREWMIGPLELSYICLVTNFHIAWLIYGNTIQYSEEQEICRHMNSATNTLWILMMVIIAIGYVQFLIYGFIYCFLCCGFCCLSFCAAKLRNSITGRNNSSAENSANNALD